MAPDGDRPLRRQRMATVVADKIAHEIVEQRLEPGHVLPSEAEMIKRFGVARGTLREALLLLESEGLIVVRTGRSGGPVVQRPTTDRLAHLLSLMLSVSRTSFRSVLEARRLIEPELAALAAQARRRDEVQLAQIMAELRNAVDDEPQFLEVNRTFHHVVASLGENEALTAFWFAIERISDGHQVGVHFSRAARLAAIDSHDAIRIAIEERNPHLASSLMATHLDGFTQLIAKHYPHLLEHQIKMLPGADQHTA